MKPIEKISRASLLLILLLIWITTHAQNERKYYGVEIDGVLCGYSTSDATTAEYLGKQVREVRDSVHLMLKVLGQDMNADIIAHYYIDPESKKVLFNESQYSSHDAGRIVTTKTEIFDDYAIHRQEESGIVTNISLEDGVLFDNPEITPYLLEDFSGANAGPRKYRIFNFLKGIVDEQEVTLLGEEEIELAGMNFTTIVFEAYNSNDGTRTKVWVNKEDASTVQFEVMNRRIFLAGSEVRKMIKTVDLDNSIFAKVDKNIANFMDMTYLKVEADIKSAGQEILADDLSFSGQEFDGVVTENHIKGTFVIEPTRYDGLDAPPFPMDYSDVEKLEKYLNPELYIESDHPDIIAMAEEITDGAEDSWDAAVRLSKWVGKEIAGAVPGGTSAINTLRIREGECGSHSRLLAAFCRSVGIPSRLAVGCLYSPWYGGSFGQHAWTEIYMGEEHGWIAVDATILEFDYVDAGHIKLGELTSFNPNSMEILEYRIGDEEFASGVPEEYKEYIGTYMKPDNRDVLEVFYQDGSLTVDILGRMKLALHEPDEKGRMYAKLTDKIYFSFPDGDMHVVENAFAMKRADVEIEIEEGTPEEYVHMVGPYMIMAAQREFVVSWNNGLQMQPPRVDHARALLETEDGRWRDTVDGKEYAFAFSSDGSVRGMDIFIKSVLKPGTTASFIINKAIKEDGIEAAREKFKELWDNRALDLEHTERDLNNLGYKYLGEDKLDEALVVFELNAETFPESWNVYDSYGEALMKNGDTEMAIQNYKKSIEMNPENEGGKQMLEKLTSSEIE